MSAKGPIEAEHTFVDQLATVDHVTSFIARRHHLSAADAADFASHVRLKLIEGEYAVFRKFQGRSNLRTYLTVVIGRLFLDYRIAAWGKWRPSAEARRGGRIAMLLEQLLIRDRHTLDEACEILAAAHAVTLTRAELADIAARLPVRLRPRFEPVDALAETADARASADASIVAHERESQSARIIQVLKAVMSQLDVQDRLILTMRFEDGRTVAEIALLLRLEQKPLYRRVEALLRRLRTALEQEGIDAGTAMEAFHDVP